LDCIISKKDSTIQGYICKMQFISKLTESKGVDCIPARHCRI